jgi:hypothetical protein
MEVWTQSIPLSEYAATSDEADETATNRPDEFTVTDFQYCSEGMDVWTQSIPLSEYAATADVAAIATNRPDEFTVTESQFWFEGMDVWTQINPPSEYAAMEEYSTIATNRPDEFTVIAIQFCGIGNFIVNADWYANTFMVVTALDEYMLRKDATFAPSIFP